MKKIEYVHSLSDIELAEIQKTIKTHLSNTILFISGRVFASRFCSLPYKELQQTLYPYCGISC